MSIPTKEAGEAGKAGPQPRAARILGQASPRGPQSLGEWLDTLRDLSRFGGSLEFLKSQVERYGDFCTVNLGIKKFNILIDPAGIHYILQQNPANYVKSSPYDEARLFLGPGLLNSEGETWRANRRLVQPAFTKTQVRGFTAVMAAATREKFDLLDRSAAQSRPVELHPMMMALTMDVIARTMFTADVRSRAEDVRSALDFVNEFANQRIASLANLPIDWPLPEHIRFRFYKKLLDDLIFKLIAERRAAADKPDDLLTRLLTAVDGDSGATLSDEQLRNELMTIFLAGHETTAMGLTMAIWRLASAGPIQSELRAEIKAAGIESILADPFGNDLLGRVIDETLRMHPPAWILGRRALADDVVAGRKVNAGAEVEMPVLFVHRDPRWWPEPDEFRPERFLPENSKDRPKGSYLPFGLGPRRCVGEMFALQEMRVLLALFLDKYEFKAAQSGEPELMPLFTLRPKHPVRVLMTPV